MTARQPGGSGAGGRRKRAFKKVVVVGEDGKSEHAASLSLEGLEKVDEVCVRAACAYCVALS